MAKQVEFYFDFVSPTTYLAYTQLSKIAQRTGAEIVYKPFLLGGVFKASGNQTPMAVPAKGAWMAKDMDRFAKRYGVDMVFNPYFPINSINIMRGAVWAEEQGFLEKYCDIMFKAMWVDQVNLGDAEEVAKLLGNTEINLAQFQAAVSDQSIKDKLRATTEEAAARGAFGAPTMFVGEEMFFGQDRLDFVEEALLV
ncbi:MAG: 2-hydroxychromene-2-carboxylate isomerase [Deltaproteobacteria bacterium]|jgi:2-hydroxychromene-2-carboxylate isomerase|nr:2-hydroxychromene-2-carboxylate isomerase [Deltaproteobacteria bacterium]MBT4637825.1 2-hydroxychromene-2-carboxylate isomerase [Deltaproteobacteria bacterium]MBT6499337.1 2-hydroxychromene-2-carboxylate isomerase [Deltaproteobacteria bacterium]MBT6613794.1 2-hydroxychromene-2-carboxylate isomerase [Deltaproteobacteria bacterium]MBT7150822.1 2-hydroxychromene-2-carboxylate isomerase [Deltaproteobacteria bacterium]